MINFPKPAPCSGKHLSTVPQLMRIEDQVFTPCMHVVGYSFCGQLVDVTGDVARVTTCCGIAQNHDTTIDKRP